MHLPYVIWASAKLEIREPKINQKTIENKLKYASIEIRNAYRVRTVQIGHDEIAFGRVSWLGFPWPVEGFAPKPTPQHLPPTRITRKRVYVAFGAWPFAWNHCRCRGRAITRDITPTPNLTPTPTPAHSGVRVGVELESSPSDSDSTRPLLHRRTSFTCFSS